MKLFHGGKTLTISIPAKAHGEYFGAGFYCVTSSTKALRTSKRYNKTEILPLNFTHSDKLKIKVFEEMSPEWLQYLADYARGQSDDADIIISPLIDERHARYVRMGLSKADPQDKQLISRILSRTPHDMLYCFKTDKALKQLEKI